jgi:protein gp37
MGERTGIEWCTATWNPWRGCTKVSPGCAHCYMFDGQARYGRDPTVLLRSKTTFRDPLTWADPQTIFTCSWSDFFHEAADGWRGEAWEIIRRTPQHRYLILTKRIEHVPSRLPWPRGAPWAHVWLGVSIENGRFERRADQLLDVCAGGRFVSAEPLLAAIDIERCLGRGGIAWVIVGGESGPKARPFDLEWARQLHAQCQRTETAFFLKQLGRRPYDSAVARQMVHRAYEPTPEQAARLAPLYLRDAKGGDIAEWPAELRIRQSPWTPAPGMT